MLPGRGRAHYRPPVETTATAGPCRENAPVNHSYGLQLALVWDAPATIGTRIPAMGGARLERATSCL